ncbi:MAG: transglutaminase-like domain-containing protein [Pseudomonadales bacterium]
MAVGAYPLKVITQLDLTLSHETPIIFKLVPVSSSRQKISALQRQFSNGVVAEEFIDLYGNLGLRALLPRGATSLEVRFEGAAGESRSTNDGHFVRIERIPAQVLPYLQPSRYCESDQFNGIAREIVRGALPGQAQIDVLADYIVARFDYRPGTSQLPRSALGVFQDDGGVCRDFAHLMIAMLRSLSIPARYCVGYLQNLVPQDVHAWCEAYVGDRWITVETTPGLADGERILVAIGRDAADVAVMDQFGPLPLKSSLSVVLND